jgi:ADP-ribose pyrophosphatase YjhB (NUDIX family)
MKIKQFFSQTSHLAPIPFKYCPHCGTPLQNHKCLTCDYKQYFNPAPTVTILVCRDGELLIGKRKNEPKKWAIPGGFIEYNECFLETVHREVLEETGFHIKLRGICNVMTSHVSPVVQTLVITVLCDVIGGQETPLGDLTELKWIRNYHEATDIAFKTDDYLIKSFFQNTLTLFPIDDRFIQLNQSIHSGG